MDRTSWKPKIYKATEAVDYKAEEEGTSDGAKKGWLTRQRGGSADKTDYSDKKDVYFKNDDGTVEKKSMSLDEFEKVKDDYKASGWSEAGSRPSDLQKEYEKQKEDKKDFDWAGTVGSQQSWEIQNLTDDLMDFASDLEIKFGEGSDEVVDGIIERYGTNQFPQEVIDILEDENYHSVNRVIGISDETPNMPDVNTKSSFLPDFADKKRYEEIVDNTMNAIGTTKINGFPFWKYVGTPDKILEDGKGGIVMYGMKRNPNSIRRVDVKYDEGRDTYTVSFMSNRNKPKGEYNDVYFDQLGGLIAGNKGLGVESYAKESIDTVDDYFDYVDEEPDERKCEFCGAKITSLFSKKYMIDHVNSVHDAGLNPTDGQKLNKTFPSWGESYATEDDYKYDWDQLTSLAQKALSDIGYDKESWDSEPEDIRKEMEKVAYSEENWKDVANKFYKEELNKDKKNGGEAMYGYGSATGRMSPVEAWNQGADVYGDMGYDQSLRNPIFTDFRGLQWNELPTDIQEAWKSELGYMTKGEGLVDNIEKQLNRFGVNLDRDPEQVEESKADDIRNAIAQDHEQWKKKQEPEQARQFLNNHQIPLSNKQSDYYPYDWGNQNSFSEDGFALSDTLAKNQGQSWQEGGEADPCWKGYKQIGMKDKNGKQVPNCVPNASESVLEKVHVNGWEFSVIDDGYGGGWADTANTGTYEVGIFAPDDGNPNGQKSAIKGWLTPEEVDDLKRTFEVDPVMAYRRIGGEWEEDWQEGGESKASEYVIPHDWMNRLDPLATLVDNFDSDNWGGDNPDELMKCIHCDYTMNDGSKSDTNQRLAVDHMVNNHINEFDEYDKKIRCPKCNSKSIDTYYDEMVRPKRNRLTCYTCGNTFDMVGESKASEAEDDWVDKYFEFENWIEDGEMIGVLRKCKLCGMKFESFKIGEQREHLINNHGFTLNELEGNISSYEGFNQGLYGYVDAKCKTCGIEFDSIPDMDDHYAMNSDHVSNLNDLDSDIPNSD